MLGCGAGQGQYIYYGILCINSNVEDTTYMHHVHKIEVPPLSLILVLGERKREKMERESWRDVDVAFRDCFEISFVT